MSYCRTRLEETTDSYEHYHEASNFQYHGKNLNVSFFSLVYDSYFPLFNGFFFLLKKLFFLDLIKNKQKIEKFQVNGVLGF